jgi:hypothetical protein
MERPPLAACGREWERWVWGGGAGLPELGGGAPPRVWLQPAIEGSKFPPLRSYSGSVSSKGPLK